MLVGSVCQCFVVASGRAEIEDLVGRAERAFATSRELQRAAKLSIVQRLVRPSHPSVRLEDGGDLGSDEATHDGPSLQTRFPRSVRAPRLARHELVEWLNRSLSFEDERRATLAVSELMTNAATHGRGEITMRAGLDHTRLRVEVVDEGTGFVYQAPEVPIEQMSRRGLAIVAAVTTSWGIRDGAACVWFEIQRTGPQIRHRAGHGETRRTRAAPVSNLSPEAPAASRSC